MEGMIGIVLGTAAFYMLIVALLNRIPALKRRRRRVHGFVFAGMLLLSGGTFAYGIHLGGWGGLGFALLGAALTAGTLVGGAAVLVFKWVNRNSTKL